MHHQLKYSMIKLCSKKCVQWKTWDLKSVNVHYAASLLLLTLSDGLRSGINISLCDSISLNSLDFPGEKVGTSGSLRPESVHNILVQYICTKNTSTTVVSTFWLHNIVNKNYYRLTEDRCKIHVGKSQSWKIGHDGHKLYQSDYW